MRSAVTSRSRWCARHRAPRTTGALHPQADVPLCPPVVATRIPTGWNITPRPSTNPTARHSPLNARFSQLQDPSAHGPLVPLLERATCRSSSSKSRRKRNLRRRPQRVPRPRIQPMANGLPTGETRESSDDVGHHDNVLLSSIMIFVESRGSSKRPAEFSKMTGRGRPQR